MSAVRAWWLTRPDARAVWFTVSAAQATIFADLGWEVVRVVARDDVTLEQGVRLVDQGS